MGAKYTNEITVLLIRCRSDLHPDTRYNVSVYSAGGFGTTYGNYEDVGDARTEADTLAKRNGWKFDDKTGKPCVVTITPTHAPTVTLDFDHEPSVDEMQERLEELASDLTPGGYAAEHIVTNGGGFSFEVQPIP
jgi:hypothetical protein